MHWACSGGHANILSFLIERGLNIDIRDDSRWTPLIIAASAGHEPCVHLLLGKVIFKRLKLTNRQLTPINVKFIGAGAKVDACTDQGRSSLLYACSKSHVSIAKKLLDEGADINIQDKFGATPLHRAAGCGRLEMVKFLLNSANCMDLNMQECQAVAY